VKSHVSPISAVLPAHVPSPPPVGIYPSGEHWTTEHIALSVVQKPPGKQIRVKEPLRGEVPELHVIVHVPPTRVVVLAQSPAVPSGGVVVLSG